MICRANQWTGFYMIRTSGMKKLSKCKTHQNLKTSENLKKPLKTLLTNKLRQRTMGMR